MVNAPDNLDTLRVHLGRGLDLIKAKAPGYDTAREYYDGTRAEVFASTTVRKLLAGAAESTPISLAHIPVDVIADKVELASIVAKGPGKEALVTVIDKNDLEDEADDIIRKACYLGDFYSIVDPTEEDASGNPVVDGIRVVGSSPLSTVMVYDPQDERTKLYGVKVWRDGKRWRSLTFYDDATVKLATEELGADATPKAEQFEPDVADDESADDLDHYIVHDGGRMLLVHLAIDGKPYGVPVHKKAFGPQDAITKISATNLTNVDGQGFASRWALLDPAAEIDDDIDDDFGDAGPTAPGESPSDGLTTATSSSGRNNLRDVPGAIKILRGIKQVGQFDSTPTEHFLKNLDWYVRVMAVATGIALFEFDLNGEQPSGESRRRAEGRANKKAAKIKRQAGAFFTELGDTVLAVLGIEDEVEATFNPSETSTDLDGLELVSAKIKAGVPVTQALLEAGYTDEQVGDWYPDGKPHVTPEVLTILATALQALGQAKTLGVITDEELRDMLPTILTAARNEGPAPAAPVAPSGGLASSSAALAAAARLRGEPAA